VLDVLLGFQHSDFRYLVGERLQQSPHDEPRVGSTQTKVRAEAEGKVGIGFAIETDLLRRLENALIKVGCGPA